MIFIGDHTTLVDNSTGLSYLDNPLIFNLSSPLEGFDRLDIIPNGIMLVDGMEQQFDIDYANWILQYMKTDELMKILMPHYQGLNVYILIYRDNSYFDAVTESIMKFIQHRYGIVPIIINDPIDYDFIPTQYNMSFSVQGLYNFDIDKEQYVRNKTKEAYYNGVRELPEGFLY